MSNMTKVNAVLRMKVHQNDHNRIYQKLHLRIFEQQPCHLDQRTFLPSLKIFFIVNIKFRVELNLISYLKIGPIFICLFFQFLGRLLDIFSH